MTHSPSSPPLSMWMRMTTNEAWTGVNSGLPRNQNVGADSRLTHSADCVCPGHCLREAHGAALALVFLGQRISAAWFNLASAPTLLRDKRAASPSNRVEPQA